MKAILYKDFSDASSIVEMAYGITIYENMPGVNFEDKTILVNGTEKTADYILSEGDIVVIRTNPGVISATALTVITIVSAAVAVVSIGVAIYAGVQAYQASEAAAKAIAEAETASTDTDDITSIPYIKGASNSIASGKTQPYVIGEHLFTPYKLTNGWYSLEGLLYGTTGQYYYLVFEGGFAKQVLRKIYADDVLLKDWGSGLAIPQNGQYAFDTSSPFYSADSFIEVAQNGSFTESGFNRKVVLQTPGDQILKSDDSSYAILNYTLEDYTMSFDICFMVNGLVAYLDDGTKTTRTVDLLMQYLIPGGSWTDVPGLSTTFSGIFLEQHRYVRGMTFDYNAVKNITEPIQIRIICGTPAYDGTAYDDIYIERIQSTIYNKDKSAAAGAFVLEKPIEDEEALLSTMIGLKIKMTPANYEKLTKINVITSGVARTWSGTEWSTTKIPTRNPAAWLLEVLTSDTHKASQCDDSEIDLDSLGELYAWCSSTSRYIDMVLTEGDTKDSLLETILNTCDTVMYQNVYGKLAFATDKSNANASAIINTQNCIAFENKKDIARLADGVRVTYINSSEDYVSDSYLVMRTGVTRTADSTLRDVDVTGITTYAAIVRYARRLMAIEKLRPKAVTAKVGKEGVYYKPLDKILVQHPSLKIGLGSAEIQYVLVDGSNIIGLELYEPIYFDSTVTDGYGMIVQCVSDTYSTPLSVAYNSPTNGMVKDIYFVTPISLTATTIPHAGDILSYGYLSEGSFDTITSPMLITGIEPDSEGFTLTLCDYNEAIYTTGDIPDYTPNITTRRLATSVPSEIPAATKDDVAEAVSGIKVGNSTYVPSNITEMSAIAEQTGIALSWTWSSSGLANTVDVFELWVSKDSGTTLTQLSSVKTNSGFYTFDRDTDGYPSVSDLSTWRFYVKAKNIYGNESVTYGPSTAGQTVTTTTYVGWAPIVPSLSTGVNGRGITLGWSNSASWYGKGKADIQIAKGYTVVSGAPVLITDLTTLVAYAPASGLDPKLSYDNYKTGDVDGYASKDGSVMSVSVPLYGQNETPAVAVNTPYYIRVRTSTDKPTTASPSAREVSSWTAWELVYGMATNAQDIVENAINTAAIVDDAITANKISVAMLSAITANLGVITDGAMVGNENNMWAVSRIYDTDGVTVLYYEGTMRVGGTNQYLKVTPVVVGGVITSYEIDFKVGNFTVTATGSIINGAFEVRNVADNNVYFKIDPTRNGTVEIKNSIEVGDPISPTARITAKEGFSVTDIAFSGTGLNDLDVIETGTDEADIEVKIVATDSFSAISSLSLTKSCIDPENNVWGINGKNVYKCTAGTDTFALVCAFSGTIDLQAICSDLSGNILLGRNEGIYKIPHGTTEATLLYSLSLYYTSEISAIVVNTAGDVWVFVLGSLGTIAGAYRCGYGETTLSPVGNQYTLYNDACSDSIGNIWAIGNNGGVADFYKCSAGTTTLILIQETSTVGVTRMCADVSSNILATTTAGAIYRCPVGATTFVFMSSISAICRDLCSDNLGNIYVVTYNGYIYKCLHDTTIFIAITSTIYDFNCITADKLGTVWASHKSAVQKMSPGVIWRANAGAWSTVEALIANTQYELAGYGIKIQFPISYGHVSGDSWMFSQSLLKALSTQDKYGVEFFHASSGVVRIACEEHTDISASATLVTTDVNIHVTTADAVTLTIPSGMPVGKRITILRTVSSSSSITFATSGSETVEGSTSFVTHGAQTVAILNPNEVTMRKTASGEWRFVAGIVSGSNANGEYLLSPSGAVDEYITTSHTTTDQTSSKLVTHPYAFILAMGFYFTYGILNTSSSVAEDVIEWDLGGVTATTHRQFVRARAGGATTQTQTVKTHIHAQWRAA